MINATFHYPNGIPYNHHEAQSPKEQVKRERPVEFGNRGMGFEEAINQNNQYYLLNKQAVVHKKPTSAQVVKVDYPKRSAAITKEIYSRQASTTDYNSIYQGHYIDFEAKETKNTKPSLFKNFHRHQTDHMKQCIAQQRICFVLL